MTKNARHGQLLSLSNFQHSGACLYANCIMLGTQRIRILDSRDFTAILHWQIRNTGGCGEMTFVHAIQYNYGGHFAQVESEMKALFGPECSALARLTAL
jgi:hypothetical protein